ncbi:MAG: hypothetical protein COB46_02095 [Rhodospirillaceae bacterium]|nr:MAG: hypothetical protein COB46_02095 [Rhodospirillaceae bacterium]
MASRKFILAEHALNDLLDRYEKNVNSSRLLVYPDKLNMKSVDDWKKFNRTVQQAENAEAVEVIWGKGQDSQLIRYVRLKDTDNLYIFLGRQPISQLIDVGLKQLRHEFEKILDWASPIIDAYESQLRTGKKASLKPSLEDLGGWQKLFAVVSSMRNSGHNNVDMRTFSRLTTQDSKWIEKNMGSIIRALEILGWEMPKGANSEEKLRYLGLEKFPAPVLIAGEFIIDDLSNQIIAHPYLGIPPEWVEKIRVLTDPTYILIIENLASFNRYVREVDRDGCIVIYGGGFPSRTVLNVVQVLDTKLSNKVPFLCWGDIDLPGVHIFRVFEKSINRPLQPHMMNIELAEQFGELTEPRKSTRDKNSLISELEKYLGCPDCKTIEQEAFNPVAPDLNSIAYQTP